MSFPQGYFYIISKKHNLALDVYDAKTEEGAKVIVWPQKLQDGDNQLWRFDQGRLINKNSGHALDVRTTGYIKKDSFIMQDKVKEERRLQQWRLEDGFICSEEFLHDKMVFDIRGDSKSEGAEVMLYKRKDTDNLNQLWKIEPYIGGDVQIESSLPLHKKESFGKPRPGYGAEIGVPSELKALPASCKIAGLDSVGATASDPPKAPANRPSQPHMAAPQRESSNYGNFYSAPSLPPRQQQQQQPPPPPPPSYPSGETSSYAYSLPSPQQPGMQPPLPPRSTPYSVSNEYPPQNPMSPGSPGGLRMPEQPPPHMPMPPHMSMPQQQQMPMPQQMPAPGSPPPVPPREQSGTNYAPYYQ